MICVFSFFIIKLLTLFLNFWHRLFWSLRSYRFSTNAVTIPYTMSFVSSESSFNFILLPANNSGTMVYWSLDFVGAFRPVQGRDQYRYAITSYSFNLPISNWHFSSCQRILNTLLSTIVRKYRWCESWSTGSSYRKLSDCLLYLCYALPPPL